MKVDRTEDVFEDVRTAYDGGAYDAAPTKGDATATAPLKSHDDTKASYLEAGATFDDYGRELTVTDLTADVERSPGWHCRLQRPVEQTDPLQSLHPARAERFTVRIPQGCPGGFDLAFDVRAVQNDRAYGGETVPEVEVVVYGEAGGVDGHRTHIGVKPAA
ncbi:hypothetical protein GCM10010297_17920 [Streptomyces malachitofuscus]|nr:hypothetical protein GCM10010297_17920 [Streptomyces malachitofuscus]